MISVSANKLIFFPVKSHNYSYLRLMNGLFYPQHILYVKATELAFEDCFHDGDWAEAVNYGTLCLHSYQKYTIGNQVLLFLKCF